MAERIKSCLANPWMPFISAILAILLMLPTLGSDRQWDDYPQTLGLKGDNFLSGPTGSLWRFFTFSHGEIERNAELRDLGMYPWWMQNDWKLSFLRPVAVMTHWVDEALWPETVWMMHLHSVLWYGAAIFFQAMVFRKIIGPGWAAGLAALLVGLNDCPAWAVCWIANRNSMICMVFACLAILSHLNWRETGKIKYVVFAVLCLVAGLMSKESAAVVGTFLLSYEIFLGKGELKNRLLSLLPYIIVGVIWWPIFRSSGYGMNGSQLYVDPSNFADFFPTVAARAPLYIQSATGFFVLDTFLMASAAVQNGFIAYCAIMTLIIGLMLIQFVRRDAQFRFWTLGMMFAILPACSAFPSDRVAQFACLGAIGLMSRVIYLVWTNKEEWIVNSSPIWKKVMGVIIAGWLFSGFIASPVLCYIHVNCFTSYTDSLKEDVVALDMEDTEDKSLIFINAPGTLEIWHFWTIRRLENRPLPKSTRMMMTGYHDLEIKRLDEKTLLVSSSEGLMKNPSAVLFRDADHALTKGEKVSLDNCNIEIVDPGDSLSVKSMKFEFESELESSSLRWLVWQPGGYQDFKLPEIGKTTTIPAQLEMSYFYGRTSTLAQIIDWFQGPQPSKAITTN